MPICIKYLYLKIRWQRPRWLSGEESTDQCKKHRLLPGLVRSHMLRGNWARESQFLSKSCTAQEVKLLKRVLSRAWAARQEKPPQWEACTLQPEWSPLSRTREKTLKQWRQSTWNKYIFKIIMWFFIINFRYVLINKPPNLLFYSTKKILNQD